MAMAKSYTSILKQIQTLQEEAERARRKEAEGVIGRIREAIKAYNLTAEDLGFTTKTRAAKAAGTGKKRRGAKAGAAAKTVKYRNDSGGTWVGRGKRPQWLRDALAAGKTLADFAVK